MTAPTPDPWADYVAAAQRLDALRQAAASVAAEQTRAVGAAQQEVTAVRARLAPQRSRLVHEFGVPEADLVPQPGELLAATQRVAGGPAAAVAALQHARATADAADASMLAPAVGSAWPAALRNLLVYGPFAVAVLLVQIVLYAIVSGHSRYGWAVAWGLLMPLVAFVLGWVTIGFVFGGSAGRVDRTPLLGALVCLAPVLVTCMGVGLLALVR